MKKLIFIFALLFLPIIYSLSTSAATWKFVWTNTTVHVPVGSSLDDYKEIPKAYLYKDGNLLNDAVVTYSYEGDWLYFLKDVNTQVVGEYTVWYKAFENTLYSPGTCTGYKTLISFIVEDKVAPDVDILCDYISIKRGSSIEELKTLMNDNVIAYDNYSECDISFIHSIDLNVIGDYIVTAKVIDNLNNYTIKEFNVNVFENALPEIYFKVPGNSLVLPLNSVVDISSYFTASDVIDGDISNKINYPIIDTSKVIAYDYTVWVINSSNQRAEYTINIEIIDDEKPQIVLSANKVILDYLEDFEAFDFQKYIMTINDNSVIDYDNLNITHNLENRVGIYHIWYTYSDGYYITDEIIEATLISKIKPVINVADITIKIDENINLYDYIDVVDPSDKNIRESLVIDDSNVNYSKEGIYYATAYAVNSSGLSETITFKIVVENNSLISNYNLPLLITSCIMLAIILALVFFILYYFVIRKKHKSI